MKRCDTMTGLGFRRYIYVLFVLLLLANGVSLSAQTVRITERNRHISSPDTAEIIRRVAVSDSLFKANPELGWDTLREAFEMAKAARFGKAIWYGGNRLASYAQMNGDHRKALSYLLQAQPYINQPYAKYKNVYYNNVGLSYSGIGRYMEALKYYNITLAVLDTMKVKKQVTDSVGVYSNIAILWARMDEIDYSIQAFNAARKIAERKRDTLQMAMAFRNLGEIYHRKNAPDESEKYYRMALELFRTKNLPDAEIGAGSLSGLAQLAQEKGDFKTALTLLDEAEQIMQEWKLPAYSIVGAAAEKGGVYLEMKDYAKARPVLEDAIKKAYAMQHVELQEMLEPKLAAMYAALGNHRDAYKHLQRYMAIRDSLIKREKTWSLEMLTNAKIEEKNKAVLTQQLHIARQKSQLQQKNLWIGGITLSTLLLLSIGIAVMRNYRHKQAAQQSLIYQLQQKDEINQLKAQVRGEEQERQRIARELHDSIASQLWAIKLNVDSMKQVQHADGVQRERLEVIFNQLADATQDVRKTAHNLMPDLLLEEGLATALALVCEKTRINTGLEVDFQEYGIVPEIDTEIELSIYRMVQELIQNVLKHGKGATYLLVQLSCADTLLNITVEDNGMVLKEGEYKDGMGLREIRKRVAALKGHFDLQSMPGKGTTAYLEFDLQHLL